MKIKAVSIRKEGLGIIVIQDDKGTAIEVDLVAECLRAINPTDV